MQNGYEEALLGKSKKPPRMSMEDFEEMDLKARFMIHLCLSNSVLSEARVIIHDKIGGKRLLVRRKLHSLHLEEGSSLKSHKDEFDLIVMDLCNLDVNFDDEDLAMKLLCSLPKEYKHFRETILYGKDVSTFEDVKGALL